MWSLLTVGVGANGGRSQAGEERELHGVEFVGGQRAGETQPSLSLAFIPHSGPSSWVWVQTSRLRERGLPDLSIEGSRGIRRFTLT